MSKANICREWRTKHPEMPTLKLARIIFAKDGQAFNSVEDARSALRRIEGKAKDGTIVTHPHPPRVLNPYSLPKSDETSYTPYILRAKKILLLSDIHVPYHSIEALTAVFNYAKKEKPDAILLNGDTLDFFGLSRFVKDPRKRHFAEELEAFTGLIAVIKKTFPKAKLYFKTGNKSENKISDKLSDKITDKANDIIEDADKIKKML